MDFDTNNYTRKKTFAALILVYAILTANAFALAFTQKMADFMDYYTILTFLLASLMVLEVTAILLLTAQMAMNVERKEHQKGLMGVAQGTTVVMLNIFVVNIVVAVLNHYCMISMYDKLTAAAAANASAGGN